MTFEDHVFIGSLKDIESKIEESYKEVYTSGSYSFRQRPLETSYFKNLNQSKFVQSTVAKANRDIIKPETRSSKIFKNCGIKVSLNNYYKRNIDTTKVKPLKSSLHCNYASNFDLIKYEVEDHFNEFHYDTMKPGIVATILIFPPSSLTESEYTGGDLVFKIDNVEHTIVTSEFKELTCIIFGPVLHKCTPVTSGTRYVFKGAIKASLPKVLSVENQFSIEKIESTKLSEIDYNDSFKEQKQNLRDIIDEYYKNKIKYVNKHLPEKLDPNVNELDDFNDKEFQIKYIEARRKLSVMRNLCNPSICDYKLQDKKYNICVLPYYIESLNDLSLYQSETLDYIKKLIIDGWNVTAIYNKFNIKTDYEDDERRVYSTGFYGDLTGYDDGDDCYNCGSKYVLHATESDIECGQCLDYHSEYNDQSGDDIYEEYKCVCLIVWKE